MQLQQSLDAVARELPRFRGSQFDPQVIDAFLAMYEREGDEFLAAKLELGDVCRNFKGGTFKDGNLGDRA